MSETTIKTGGSATADGADFVKAWHRIERGDDRVDRVISFESWEGLARVMTTGRLRLLQHLHAQEEASIVALAKALGRQYRRVHDDVTLLVRSGLVERDGNKLRATVDRIKAVIEFI